MGNREARTKGARRGDHAKINAASSREAHKGDSFNSMERCAPLPLEINNLRAIRAGTKCAQLLAKIGRRIITHIDKFSNGVILFG
jgi:hypothetical protein